MGACPEVYIFRAASLGTYIEPPQAPQSRLAFPLVLFQKSRQNGSEGSTGLFWGGLTLG